MTGRPVLSGCAASGLSSGGTRPPEAGPGGFGTPGPTDGLRPPGGASRVARREAADGGGRAVGAPGTGSAGRGRAAGGAPARACSLVPGAAGAGRIAARPQLARLAARAAGPSAGGGKTGTLRPAVAPGEKEPRARAGSAPDRAEMPGRNAPPPAAAAGVRRADGPPRAPAVPGESGGRAGPGASLAKAAGPAPRPGPAGRPGLAAPRLDAPSRPAARAPAGTAATPPPGPGQGARRKPQSGRPSVGGPTGAGPSGGRRAGAVLLALGLRLLAAVVPVAVLAPAVLAQVHEGVASCAGSTCHGRQAPTGAVVRQNELLTWQDPASPAGAHSRAFRVLLWPESRRMAERLAIGPAEAAPVCLSCHADDVPPARRGPRFRIEDGVGCEACHGGAGARPDGSPGWLASHAAVGASHAANVRAGLFPAGDLLARAGLCLDCHFGSGRPEQFVTHRLMAAGHPRLVFELDLFTALQAHHDEDADYRARKPVFSGLAVWAAGQALASARQLRLFATRGTDGAFPEFTFFDCRTCHRPFSDARGLKPLSRASQWRPIPSGFPAFADENLILMAAAARVLAPARAEALAARSAAFHRAFGESRPAAEKAALSLADAAEDLARALAARPPDAAAALRIIADITDRRYLTRVSEYQGGAQTLMAIETLVASQVRAGLISAARARGLRPALDEAHALLRDADRWDGEAFARALLRLGAAARAML